MAEEKEGRLTTAMFARYRRVALSSLAATLPAETVTSEEIEDRLAAVYDRLAFPAGRLEMMTGIRERRFFPRGTRPGEWSARTAKNALAISGLDPHRIGLLIHGSVCRDRMEPATACGVHSACGLPNSAPAFDISNACLGLVDALLVVADRIEAGIIDAGVVVGTEMGRTLVEDTIAWLTGSERITRSDVKGAFASLTIGSASAAIVLCREHLATDAPHLREVVCRSHTGAHELCAGGATGELATLMETDSEALLQAGVGLAQESLTAARSEFDWNTQPFDRFVMHQVGRAHQKAICDALALEADRDFPTFSFLGNTGSTALPIAAALAFEAGAFSPADSVGWLAIGSGLNCSLLRFDGGRVAVARCDLTEQ